MWPQISFLQETKYYDQIPALIKSNPSQEVIPIPKGYLLMSGIDWLKNIGKKRLFLLNY